MKKEYNKMVRDNIPAILKKKGIKHRIRIAETDQEFDYFLHEKLKEEVNEYLNSKDIHEIADIFEVLYAIMRRQGISTTAVHKVIDYKGLINGHLTDGVILEWTEEDE